MAEESQQTSQTWADPYGLGDGAPIESLEDQGEDPNEQSIEDQDDESDEPDSLQVDASDPDSETTDDGDSDDATTGEEGETEKERDLRLDYDSRLQQRDRLWQGERDRLANDVTALSQRLESALENQETNATDNEELATKGELRAAVKSANKTAAQQPAEPTEAEAQAAQQAAVGELLLGAFGQSIYSIDDFATKQLIGKDPVFARMDNPLEKAVYADRKMAEFNAAQKAKPAKQKARTKELRNLPSSSGQRGGGSPPSSRGRGGGDMEGLSDIGQDLLSLQKRLGIKSQVGRARG